MIAKRDKSKDPKKDKESAKKGDSLDIPRNEYDILLKEKERADQYYDKWLRLQAEFENTKKRLDRERIEAIKYASTDIIAKILPIIDDFDRAVEAVKATKDIDSLLKGVQIIRAEIDKILKQDGVERVESIGQPFDPHVHEAMMMVETDDHPEGTVIEELQPGYKLNGRLLRPAKVKVSKKKT
ncbi:MAG: nucleotide exchange factor GrpE [Candidatus Omnitrophica bacterium]|nr:nucleotide exchange factor GrpE [Candidatus Omnitrophota bacterium]